MKSTTKQTARAKPQDFCEMNIPPPLLLHPIWEKHHSSYYTILKNSLAGTSPDNTVDAERCVKKIVVRPLPTPSFLCDKNRWEVGILIASNFEINNIPSKIMKQQEYTELMT